MLALVFDLDGTLVQFDRPYDDLLHAAFESVTEDVPEAWMETYNETFFDHFRACTPAPVARTAAELEGCPDPTAVADALLAQEVDATQAIDAHRAELERLADTHQIGVLTNGLPAWQRQKLEATGLEPSVDAFVASYEAGAHKPDVAPYRLLEERLDASRYAMIGDAATDIEGAKTAGWGTYRYDGGDFAELPDAIEWDR
ncbi:haloacid dehalogenase superfamily enzyme, subfamily IA [Halovivax ruber XH-70]|uniref:Haloacid dehalogenase superfamily enzyme, subfamily IA n=1 Tax=Halovivax ruber (strain DSM 18193 / JCM 13892 / XH-70) TaxID=797302 RepID=L0ID76_HALRX|nr:HAD family hydrolase [Halovivax ruber]AGB16719.1 haloacid dehalogenase superfamily enzyme, subfamily IA [Halovivax ruber XH-70]